MLKLLHVASCFSISSTVGYIGTLMHASTNNKNSYFHYLHRTDLFFLMFFLLPLAFFVDFHWRWWWWHSHAGNLLSSQVCCFLVAFIVTLSTLSEWISFRTSKTNQCIAGDQHQSINVVLVMLFPFDIPLSKKTRLQMTTRLTFAVCVSVWQNHRWCTKTEWPPWVKAAHRHEQIPSLGLAW